MTAAVARVATPDDHPLVRGYVAYCRSLPVSDRALRDRLRLARRFLEHHPDLDAWMTRPVRARLADLRRIRAWPLISYALLAGRVRVDLDLLVAKDLGGFGRTAEVMFAADVAHARQACARLGWSPRWTLDITRECLPLVLAWCGRPMRELSTADLDAFAAAWRPRRTRRRPRARPTTPACTVCVGCSTSAGSSTSRPSAASGAPRPPSGWRWCPRPRSAG